MRNIDISQYSMASSTDKHRVMLWLSAEENAFVEGLAKQLAQPGVEFTRQDAIRNVLAKLRSQLDAEMLSPMLPIGTEKKKQPAKRAA